MELSKQIKARSLDLPKGINAREHVLRIVYQELVNLVGKEAGPLKTAEDSDGRSAGFG